MYNLTKEHIESVENFISKLDASIVRSKYEKWLAEVKPTERATSEQMEFFVSLALHLPAETQPFPQAFAMAVKNAPSTDRDELDFKKKDKTDLLTPVDDTIADVKDKKAPIENKEETLHKLGVEEDSVDGKKVSTAGKKKEEPKAAAPKKDAPKKTATKTAKKK